MNSFSYELLYSEVDQYKKVNLAYAKGVIDNLSVEIKQSYMESYEYGPKKKLMDIAAWIGDLSVKCIGDVNDFHNISVVYARLDIYDGACIILERGLTANPMNIDLIADSIEYSLKCGEEGMKRSQKYYRRLQTIPQDEWNWRAFSFSIDYFMERYDKAKSRDKRKQIKNDVLNLADEFIAKENTDRAYYDKSEIYRRFGNKEKELEVLNEAVEKLATAQQCKFRIADIEFEKGHHQESIEILRSCLFDFRILDSINKGAAFLILALSRTSVYFGKSNQGRDEADEKEINAIYKDIDSARTYGLDQLENTADILEKVIEQQTGIKPKSEEQETSSSEEGKFDF